MTVNDKALNHAWSYFALHANQRITVFNYFVVFSGVICTGIAAAIQAPPRLALVVVALGMLLATLSLVFWKLDQRTAFLVKHAEAVIKQLEPSTAPLLADEEQKTLAAKRDKRMWTYGEAFRIIFVAMALIGIIGVVVGGLSAAGVLDWSGAKIAPTSRATPAARTHSAGPGNPGTATPAPKLPKTRSQP